MSSGTLGLYSLTHSLQSKFKTINFCNKWRKRGKKHAWHTNEMFGHKTEMLDFLS